MDNLNPEPVCEIDKWGTRRWRLNGQLHRTAGPAVVWTGGSQEWWVHDQRHRTAGPAVIETDGTQVWYSNGQRHRTDGAAVIAADGTQEWFINGKDITKEVEKWMNERNIRWPFSDEETSTQLKNQLTYF